MEKVQMSFSIITIIMKVKELIEELEKCDKNLRVVCIENSTEYTPDYVEVIEQNRYDQATGELIVEEIVYIH